MKEMMEAEKNWLYKGVIENRENVGILLFLR